LRIAEPDHAIAIRFKLLRARPVPLRLCFVDAAVNFDDQPIRCTIEVGNERPQGMLSPELQTIEPPGPQSLPQRLFRLASFAAAIPWLAVAPPPMCEYDGSSFF